MAEATKRDMAVVQNLIDAGCDERLVDCFFKLERLGREREQICLLCEHRRELLDSIHDTQKRLDCLDYLLYRMRKKNADQ